MLLFLAVSRRITDIYAHTPTHTKRSSIEVFEEMKISKIGKIPLNMFDVVVYRNLFIYDAEKGSIKLNDLIRKHFDDREHILYFDMVFNVNRHKAPA